MELAQRHALVWQAHIGAGDRFVVMDTCVNLATCTYGSGCVVSWKGAVIRSLRWFLSYQLVGGRSEIMTVNVLLCLTERSMVCCVTSQGVKKKRCGVFKRRFERFKGRLDKFIDEDDR